MHSQKNLRFVVFALWITGCVLLMTEAKRISQIVHSTKQHLDPYNLDSDTSPRLQGSHYSEAERLLLYGDPNAIDPVEQWKPLHESDPTNPSFYALYLGQLSELPENYREFSTQIDPDNGWFPLWEASTRKDEVVALIRSKRKTSRQDRDPTVIEDPAEYKIINPAEFAELVGLIETATRAPRIETYHEKLTRQRFDLLPQPVDTISNFANVAYLAGQATPNIRTWRKAHDIMIAALQEAPDEAQFLRLEKMANVLEERNASSIQTLVDGLVSRALSHSFAKSLRAAATRLGLEEKASFYEAKQLRFQFYQDNSRKKESSEFTRLINNRANIFMTLAAPASHRMVKTPPQLTRADLQPGLRAERAIFSRIFYGLVFLLLSLIALLVWLRNRGKDNPATFLPDLKVLACGVLLPVTGLIIFRYFLSFGMLDYGGRMLVFSNYLFPDLATFLIILITPLCLLRSRDASSVRKNWWPLGLAILGLLFSALVPSRFLDIWLLAFYLPLLFLVPASLWLLLQPFRKKSSSFDLNGHLAPAYLFAATLVSFSVFGLSYEEKYWFNKNKIERPSIHGISQIEDTLVQIMKIELAELKNE